MDNPDNTERTEGGMDFFGDIPLKEAVIGWTPKGRRGRYPLPAIQGRIVVIPQARDGHDWFRYFGVTDSNGACFTEWETLTKEQRLLKLYIEAWHIIARDGVAPEAVHAAFMVIPEYRDSLSGETFFSWAIPQPSAIKKTS